MPPDIGLSRVITDFAGSHEYLDDVMQVVASNYFAPRIAALILLCVWFGTRDSVKRYSNQKAIVSIGFGVVIGFAIAELLCLVQDYVGDFWARPYDAHAEGQAAMDLLYFRLPDSSFPSNAMAGAVPIAVGLWFADRRASYLMWVVTVLWGFGRVYVGIHYPIDILGGILVGVTGIFLGRKLVQSLDSQVSFLLSGVRRLYLA